MPLSLSS